MDGIHPDYPSLLARHREIQSPIFKRVSVDFGGGAQHALAAEDLLIDQRTRSGYSPALLEKMFDMGRYWLMLTCGRYPVQPMAGEVNININLQVSAGTIGNLPEAMASYYDWIEGLLPDCRKNAENIFGARGAVFPILPNKEMGVSYLYASHAGQGIWPHPYWISAGGWCYSPFWDHYLVTGDLNFLRDRVVPGLKELALFYEDFLTLTDERGNYVFVPSFSPENWPADAEALPLSPWPDSPGPPMVPPAPLVINASMDIMVCREVLTRLIEASEILGTDADNVVKWKAMLAKMPPYLVDTDGALKEWAWPTLEEHLDHRHVSHLYGAWPGDEIDPGLTPELAKAALLADRKRAPGNSSAHGLCHRGLAGARLKDCYLVNFELKQLLEQGYVGPSLLTSHNPYRPPFPDAQGALPTIIMEMLVYSRPGLIELLPALPASLEKGAIRGMLARTFVKLDQLTWDMEAKSEDLVLTSLRKQIVTLVVRHGIESIVGPDGVVSKTPQPGAESCELRLPAGEPVTLHLKLHSRAPVSWASHAQA
ncbi:MAG: glycosyl hydrolase family 95 catalytic domain-containing protein [Bryobacteraceae bacterium]